MPRQEILEGLRCLGPVRRAAGCGVQTRMDAEGRGTWVQGRPVAAIGEALLQPRDILGDTLKRGNIGDRLLPGASGQRIGPVQELIDQVHRHILHPWLPIDHRHRLHDHLHLCRASKGCLECGPRPRKAGHDPERSHVPLTTVRVIRDVYAKDLAIDADLSLRPIGDCLEAVKGSVWPDRRALELERIDGNHEPQVSFGGWWRHQNRYIVRPKIWPAMCDPRDRQA